MIGAQDGEWLRTRAATSRRITSSLGLSEARMTVGLEAVLDLPRTPLGDETRELVTRGDLAGASFAFQTARDAWCQSADGTPPRVIEEIGSISDVSVCALPAYPATSVMVRAAMNQSAAAAADNRRRQLELLGVDLGAPETRWGKPMAPPSWWRPPISTWRHGCGHVVGAIPWGGAGR